MKNKVQEVQPLHINKLKDIQKHFWITMDIEYFENLTDLMPQRSKNVMQTKGCMTKILDIKTYIAVNMHFFDQKHNFC